MGELQAGKAQLAGRGGHTGQGRAGLGAEAVGVGLYPLHTVQIAGVDHEAVHAAVRAQQVRAVAQHKGPGGQFAGLGKQQDELLAVLGKGHAAGRAADAE